MFIVSANEPAAEFWFGKEVSRTSPIAGFLKYASVFSLLVFLIRKRRSNWSYLCTLFLKSFLVVQNFSKDLKIGFISYTTLFYKNQ